MGDVLDIGESANDYIRANVKFNLVIVLPWLFLTLILEIFSYINAPWINTFANSGLLIVLFIFIIAIFAPILIIILWDCKPIAESELKTAILSLSKSLGVKFRGIMSWDAMNKTLVTAGVIGLIAKFRYLMITPQLMRLLDKEETLAVAGHEIGHVKKKHLPLYLLFFICFMILFFIIRSWLIVFLISTDFGLSLIVTGNGVDNSAINLYETFLFIVLFIVYFRFIFGYFMRSFERQADAFCFEAGIGPNPLISSFMKLGVAVGDDGKKPNWHHYGLGQRIDFLRKCIADPGQVKRHNRKVNRSLIFFFSIFLIFSILLIPFTGLGWPDETSQYNFLAKVIEKRIEQQPENPDLYTTLASLYYELEKWEPAKKNYEFSLKLRYEQPDALNNLAWLLLKCPQEDLRDFEIALKLARDAARLQELSHVYDTLAEAYLANGMYKEALTAAEKALKIAKEDRKYLKDQVKKMGKRYRESKVIRI
jgi:Zn-dependent protease with chaperone function